MSILTSEDGPVRAAESAPATGWRAELGRAVRSVGVLCDRLGLDPAELGVADGVADGFPVFVPPAYLERIRPGDPADPLLRQVLPIAAEAEESVGFALDPVGDSAAEREPGLLHKYHGRALLMASHACAVHCRYCFRRHYPYSASPLGESDWRPAFDALHGDRSIAEVILSGGDPLMLPDGPLEDLVARVEAVPHVRRLRVHTRLPIVLPDRVTPALVRLLSESRLTAVVVIHCNHPQEIDRRVADRLDWLRCAGVMLLNQTVLLRGVNDSVEALASLSERLAEVGVVPYYLHQLDRVQGASHFEVPVEEGLRLINAVRERLPGYLVPRYVREVPGEAGKSVLA